jgi:hypothetical protein
LINLRDNIQSARRRLFARIAKQKEQKHSSLGGFASLRENIKNTQFNYINKI